jgi:hypothetical protein
MSCIPGQKLMKKSVIKREVIIGIKNTQKKKIFEKTKQWIATSFKNSKKVIEYENKDEGIIIGNTKISSDVTEGITTIKPFSYILKIRFDIKDNKMKIKIVNASGYYDRDYVHRENLMRESFKDDYIMKTSALIEELKTYISKKEDW